MTRATTLNDKTQQTPSTSLKRCIVMRITGRSSWAELGRHWHTARAREGGTHAVALEVGAGVGSKQARHGPLVSEDGSVHQCRPTALHVRIIEKDRAKEGSGGSRGRADRMESKKEAKQGVRDAVSQRIVTMIANDDDDDDVEVTMVLSLLNRALKQETHSSVGHH